MIKIISTLFALICLSTFAQDYELLKTRFAKSYHLDANEVKDFFKEEMQGWISNIRSNGSWKSVKYHLNDNKYSPGRHAARMDYLARAYNSKGHTFYKDKRIPKVINKAFDYWVKNPKRSYNWWHNEIGVPQRFAKVMLLMESHLGERRINQGIALLNETQIYKTGQNRLWFSEIVFIRSLFSKVRSDSVVSSKEFYGLIKLAGRGEEGIQSDLSFHQHGPLIYNGGYGAKFTLITAKLISILDGTEFEFPKNKIKLFSSFVLDSQVWLTKGDKWDYSVTGREVTRKGKNAVQLIKACGLLRKSKLKRAAEFEKCYLSLTQNKSYLSGNKAFYKSDMMIQQSKKFSISMRMYSSRTVNNDAPSNNEGLMSHHLADGATYILKNGSEYEDVFAYWDWSLVPGTTAEKKRLRPAVYTPGDWDAFAHIRYMGLSTSVAVTSDKESGISLYNFRSNKRYESVDFKKTNVFDSNGMISLGNDIKSRRSRLVRTSVEQKNSLSKTYILTGAGEVLLHDGIETYDNLKAVYHDKTIYSFLENQSITISDEYKTGDWTKINKQQTKPAPPKKIFSLWINHRLPEQNSYAYQVLPQKSLEDLKSLKELKYINTKSYSAVKLGSKTYVNLFKSGKCKVWGITVKSSSPVSLILSSDSIHLTDPTQLLERLFFSINAKNYKVKMNRFENAGKTLKIKR